MFTITCIKKVFSVDVDTAVIESMNIASTSQSNVRTSFNMQQLQTDSLPKAKLESYFGAAIDNDLHPSSGIIY